MKEKNVKYKQFIGVSFGDGRSMEFFRVDHLNGVADEEEIKELVKSYCHEDLQKYGEYKILSVDEMDYDNIISCASGEAMIKDESSDIPEFLNEMSNLMRKYKFSILTKREIAKFLYSITFSEK